MATLDSKKLLKNMQVSESYMSMVVGLLVVLVVGIIAFNFFNRQNGQLSVPGIQAPEVEENTNQATADLPNTHTVSVGENLWKIAVKYYQSGYNWVTIAKANNIVNPNSIWVGQKLSIPKADPISPAKEANKVPSTPTEVKTYTVNKGDSLWNISVKTYGNGYQWTKIAVVNKVANPNIIYPGQVLSLPQ